MIEWPGLLFAFFLTACIAGCLYAVFRVDARFGPTVHGFRRPRRFDLMRAIYYAMAAQMVIQLLYFMERLYG